MPGLNSDGTFCFPTVLNIPYDRQHNPIPRDLLAKHFTKVYPGSLTIDAAVEDAVLSALDELTWPGPRD